jgi:hypothetical protein
MKRAASMRLLADLRSEELDEHRGRVAASAVVVGRQIGAT